MAATTDDSEGKIHELVYMMVYIGVGSPRGAVALCDSSLANATVASKHEFPPIKLIGTRGPRVRDFLGICNLRVHSPSVTLAFSLLYTFPEGCSTFILAHFHLYTFKAQPRIYGIRSID